MFYCIKGQTSFIYFNDILYLSSHILIISILFKSKLVFYALLHTETSKDLVVPESVWVCGGCGGCGGGREVAAVLTSELWSPGWRLGTADCLANPASRVGKSSFTIIREWVQLKLKRKDHYRQAVLRIFAKNHLSAYLWITLQTSVPISDELTAFKR